MYLLSYVHSNIIHSFDCTLLFNRAWRPFDWTAKGGGGGGGGGEAMGAAHAAKAAAALSMRARFGGGFHGEDSDEELNPAPPPGAIGRKVW